MVDRQCRGHFDLFPSTKVNSMLKKYSIINNDIVPFLHVFNWKSNKLTHINKLTTESENYLKAYTITGIIQTPNNLEISGTRQRRTSP